MITPPPFPSQHLSRFLLPKSSPFAAAATKKLNKQRKGGFGAYSKNPAEIGATVARWLKNPELLQKMKDCALQAARPRASYDIAREIADMLFLDEDSGAGNIEPEAVVAHIGGWAGAMHTAMGGGGGLQDGLEQEQQAMMETAGGLGWEEGGGGGETAPERVKVPAG